MKPILFNAEMVRAILDGRKTVTRRIIKPQPLDTPIVFYNPEEGMNIVCHVEGMDVLLNYFPPYQPGDVLWVRETWCKYGKLDDSDHLIEGTEKYYYRADGENPTPFNDFLVQHPGWDEHRETPVWRPSIHMPHDAARIFLRVKEVRVERLNDIDNLSALDEGFDGRCSTPADGALSDWQQNYDFSVEKFASAWDRTVKPADRAIYGWDANPWVWVIEFERVKNEDE